MAESAHKRSKSGIARSLLQRVSSRQELPTLGHQDESATSSPVEDPRSPTGNASTSSESGQTPQRHPSKRSHKPHLSTSAAQTTPGTHPSSQSADSLQSPSTQGASIEQSVRLFRLFEALRSGDTAAISKAMRTSSVTVGESPTSSTTSGNLEGTTVLHIAIQCAELPAVEYIMSTADASDINARDKDGNTPLHIASMLGRVPVVKLLMEQNNLNDSTVNYQGKAPLDLARNPEIFQQLQLARSIFIDRQIKKIHALVASGDYDSLEQLLSDPRVQTAVDVNGPELATDTLTTESGGTLLHEAARNKDMKLAQLLLLNGADPFRRDKKGKLPQDVTKDDRTRAILKRSPAAAVAQRGVQEKAILGSGGPQATGSLGDTAPGGKEAREMKGYLKKWTNYTTGYKLRWFVLEDGVLSYYKHQDDAGSACRGAINMRIATLHMDASDKSRFEIHGRSSVKYHLKANHQVEAKRWFWSLNNAIQWSKDEARKEQRREKQEKAALQQAKSEQLERQQSREADGTSTTGSRDGHRTLVPRTAVGVPLTSASSRTGGFEDDDLSAYEPSVGGGDLARIASNANTATIEGDIDDEDEEYGDDASSHEAHPTSRDAFSIAAQSARLQLDLLPQISAALQAEQSKNPETPISHPTLKQALASYDTAVGNLKGLIGDLLRISRDQEAYWQYRLDREANIRRLWEDSMTKVAREQEELESKIGESEEKRRRTKRALRDVLEGNLSGVGSRAISRRGTKLPDELHDAVAGLSLREDGTAKLELPNESFAASRKRRPTLADLTNDAISDSDEDEDEEFFDAVGTGEVEVVNEMPASTLPSPEETQPSKSEGTSTRDIRDLKVADIGTSYKGYEDGVRTRLKMDADDRPKISLWGILKSMIGKDMTKMTLPVSFNEPTSLLYRVVEDMEYTELLDTAAERSDSTERLVYVTAFAASEYASTIGRVAKPFNPLLGETYEYVRPDKGYRFLIEQVSHHPPVGAAYAESAKWDYYGESAVRSKFYGKSFDINPLGTWFLRLRPSSGAPEELYTWKKVTSSVIGIITGNPT
ncbi:hypothetical protein LTR66_007396, partial [Elasticomyces elasticus]